MNFLAQGHKYTEVDRESNSNPLGPRKHAELFTSESAPILTEVLHILVPNAPKILQEGSPV